MQSCAKVNIDILAPACRLSPEAVCSFILTENRTPGGAQICFTESSNLFCNFIAYIGPTFSGASLFLVFGQHSDIETVQCPAHIPLTMFSGST